MHNNDGVDKYAGVKHMCGYSHTHVNAETNVMEHTCWHTHTYTHVDRGVTQVKDMRWQAHG